MPRSSDKTSTKTQKNSTDPRHKTEELKQLIAALESSGLDEFMEYIRSPWRMLWPNFVAGIARGIGALVGAAVIITLIGWILTKLIDIPLIGQSIEPYIRDVQNEINRYTEATNYKPHFENIEQILRDIRDKDMSVMPPQ